MKDKWQQNQKKGILKNSQKIIKSESINNRKWNTS